VRDLKMLKAVDQRRRKSSSLPLLVKHRPTLYLGVGGHVRVRSASTGKWRAVSLWARIHGGFLRALALDGRYSIVRNTPIVGKIRDVKIRRIFNEQGPEECLKQLNLQEYKELMQWYRELLQQVATPSLPAPLREELRKQVAITDRWLRAFGDWFLKRRIRLPNVPVRDDVVVAQRKYTDKQFEEVVALMSTLRKSKALEAVSGKYGFFSPEGFEKQFNKWYDRLPKNKVSNLH
jgi:hypothetical protein